MDPIDTALCDIDALHNDMRALQNRKNLIDAYYISLCYLVIAAWVRSGGLKRLRTPGAIHFHPMDLLLVVYLSRLFPNETQPIRT